MSLIHRLIGVNPDGDELVFTEERLPINESMALFGELQRGTLELSVIAERHNLTEAEVLELTGWLTAWSAQNTLDMTELRDILVLGESGLYNSYEVQVRLGLIVVEQSVVDESAKGK